jgi:hypothetical protein
LRGSWQEAWWRSLGAEAAPPARSFSPVTYTGGQYASLMVIHALLVVLRYRRAML